MTGGTTGAAGKRDGSAGRTREESPPAGRGGSGAADDRAGATAGDSVASHADHDPALRAALLRVGIRPAWLVTGALALPFVLGVARSIPRWIQYLPLVVSAVVLGMPHGAVDHLVPARLAGLDRRRSVAAVVAAYGVLGGAYLAWWFLSPATAACAFLALTWLHWGQGDVALLSAVTGGDYPRSRPHAAATLVVRGAMPMAVTLVAFPGEYRRVVADLVGAFGGSVAPVEAAFAPGFRRGLAAALAALTVLTLARGAIARHGGRRRTGRTVAGYAVRIDRGFRIDLVGTTLLWAYFLSVPPVLAIGCYFALWHSLRHVARLLAADDPAADALRAGRPTRALARFARDAAPLTALALVLVAVLSLLVPRTPGGLAEAVALYLVAIAVLTLPHVVVVTWMDHREGVWRA